MAARDADRYGVDHPDLCREEVRDFRPLASADVRALRFARRLALRPRDAPLTPHSALALLPELRRPAVAPREFPPNAWLALLDESESVYSEQLALRAQVSLPEPQVSLLAQLASRQA